MPVPFYFDFTPAAGQLLNTTNNKPGRDASASLRRATLGIFTDFAGRMVGDQQIVSGNFIVAAKFLFYLSVHDFFTNAAAFESGRGQQLQLQVTW